MSVPALRPYQVDALVATAAARAAGQNRLLVQMGTGLGKTQYFSSLPSYPPIVAWFKTLHGYHDTLVIAHREELLEQARTRLEQLNPGAVVDIEAAERHAHPAASIVVASIQTLAQRKCRRLLRLMEDHTFRLVVIDEAHHAAAPSYRTVLVHLGFLPPADATDAEGIEAPTYEDVEVMEEALAGWDARAPQDRLLVGVTATPNRSDAIGLGCVFQQIVYHYPLKQAIADQWLVPIVAWSVQSTTSLDQVHTIAGEFNQGELAHAVNTAPRNALAVAAWREHAEHVPTLAFTVDVAHAHALAEAFTEAGYTARAVSGKTPKDERRETLRAFAAGELDVVTNCMVLTEGTDLPIAGCILHTKPTKSATLYAQITGRALRLHPGKTEAIVIDIVDVARKHSLQTAPMLYGLPPGLTVQGQQLDMLEAEWDAFRETFPKFNVDGALAPGGRTLAELQAEARRVDVWAVVPLPAEFAQGRTLSWTKASDDRFQMDYPWAAGYERLRLDRDVLDRWTVTLRTIPPKDATTGLWPTPTEVVLGAQIVTAADAAAFAEAFVAEHRTTVVGLKRKDAWWRKDKPSEKQLQALRRRRVPFNPATITKGEASDLLDLASARYRPNY